MKSQKNESHIPALTGLRTLAAWLVFLQHYNPFGSWPEEHLAWKLVNECHIGVSIFFVLSGFLITKNYFEKKDFSFFSYLKNRFARIFPLFFLLSSLGFLASYFQTDTLESAWLYLANFTLLKGFFSDFYLSGIPQTWSLTVEETFYFLAPFLFFLISKSWTWLALLPWLFLGLGFSLVHLGGNESPFGFVSSKGFMLVFTFFGRSLEFFAGIFLATSLHRWPKKNVFPIYTLAGCLFSGLSLFLLAFAKGKFEFGLYSAQGFWINGLLLPYLGVAVLLAGLILEKSWLQQWLSSGLMVLLGKSSYAFYLIHVGFLARIFTDWGIHASIKFLLFNILSILLFYSVEEPLRKWIKEENPKNEK
jgi:peptidoglycan/LPS O-acetylase OafA/YrhL